MKKILFILFAVFAIIAFYPFKTKLFAAIGPYPKTMKVIEVRYFPHGTADVVYQPNDLSLKLQAMITKASTFQGYKKKTATPSVNVQIVGVYDRIGPRPNIDGTWQTTYQKILEQDNLCQQIHDLKVDQVWLWVDPRPGYDTGPGVEYAISSKYFQNQVQYATYANPAFCGGADSFVFMGFDFSRTADLALHSFGHYMEGMLTNLQTTELFWQRFSGDNSSTFPRANRCGNVHFPPNSSFDYDYANKRYVQTFCENWNPNGTGAKLRTNCNRWGCTQEGYLNWWMENMPNKDKTISYQSKTLPNWWDFVVRMDDIIPAYYNNQTYFINRSFLDANKPAVLPAQYDSQAIAKQNSGISMSWTHTTAGDNRFLVVAASYRAHNNSLAYITSLTFGGFPLTFIRRDKFSDFTTEMWYLVSPSLGANTLTADFSQDPEDQAYISTSWQGIDQINPITANAGAGSSLLDPTNPASQSISVSANTGDISLGVLSVYPDGGSNIATVASDTTKVWETYTSANNIGSYGGLEVSSATSSVVLNWTSPKNWPWTASAISIKPL